MNKGWYWKQHSHNAFCLTGPLGTSKWFETYDELYRFCQAKYIAESCGAYWLMDAIASHYGSYKNEDFAIAKLTKQTTADGWMLNIEDGNDGLLADQYFEFSDFPLDEITLYVLPQDGTRVILLPSEY